MGSLPNLFEYFTGKGLNRIRKEAIRDMVGMINSYIVRQP